MDRHTKKQITEALSGQTFSSAADLGCGYGEISKVLEKHCSYLIGVDKDILRPVMSGYHRFYNELVQADVREWELPSEVEAFFLFDLIEHLSLIEGMDLLTRIGNRFCIVTTPSKFEVMALNGHVSLWSEQLLQKFGFSTKIYSAGYLRDRVWGKKIIGVRG